MQNYYVKIFLDFLQFIWQKIPGEATFWSGLFGTFVGALIALRGQKTNIKEAREQRLADRKRSHTALARSLLFKMIRLHSNISRVDEYIYEREKLRQTEDKDAKLWQFLMPIANMPSRISFSADEMSLLLDQKDDKIFNQIMNMDSTHDALLEVLAVYHKARESVTAELSTDKIDGLKAIGTLSKEKANIVIPKLIGLESLAQELRLASSRYKSESREALDALNKLFSKSFGFSHKLVFDYEKEENKK